MDKTVLRMTDEHQFAYENRIDRMTILHEEIAKVLQKAAGVPQGYSGIAPLYLAQSFAIMEQKELRDDLIALLGG